MTASDEPHASTPGAAAISDLEVDPSSPQPRPSTRSATARLLASHGALFVVAMLIAAALALDVPTCPTAGLLGVPCPGCGMTRAAQALLLGRVSEAWHHNPSLFAVVPLTGLWCGLFLLQRGRSTGGPSRTFARLTFWLIVGAALLMAAVWALRFAGYFGGPEPVQRWVR